MKIIQFVYALEPGGAERFVVDISNELSRRGHDVTICALRDDTIDNQGFLKCEISDKVSYINLKIPYGFKLNNIALLFKLIKSLKPQIVHCHLNLVNYVFPLTFIFPQVKFFQTIHNDARKEVKNRLEYWIRRYFYTNFKMKAVTISKETSDSFIAYYKTPPFKEIYNGRVNPEPSADYTELTKEIQNFKDKGNTIFLNIGRCSAQKNQEMLINVFNKLIQNGKQVVLFILGNEFDTDKGHKLRDLAGDNIFILGEKHNIADYLLNADAFCLSSNYEGMPISLIEALACGCTPICTPVGGILNTIKHGETGYLSKSVSENDYYSAILTFLENKDQVKKEDLIQYYHSHFGIEECANKYLSLYKE